MIVNCSLQPSALKKKSKCEALSKIRPHDLGTLFLLALVREWLLTKNKTKVAQREITLESLILWMLFGPFSSVAVSIYGTYDFLVRPGTQSKKEDCTSLA